MNRNFQIPEKPLMAANHTDYTYTSDRFIDTILVKVITDVKGKKSSAQKIVGNITEKFGTGLGNLVFFGPAATAGFMIGSGNPLPIGYSAAMTLGPPAVGLSSKYMVSKKIQKLNKIMNNNSSFMKDLNAYSVRSESAKTMLESIEATSYDPSWLKNQMKTGLLRTGKKTAIAFGLGCAAGAVYRLLAK